MTRKTRVRTPAAKSTPTVSSDPSSLEVLAPGNLPFQLHLLVQSLTRRMQKVLDPFNLTPLHWGILCCLWRQEGLSPTDFAEQLSQLGGTITVALQALERRKLIVRRANRDDGRATQLYLTAPGRSLEQVLVPLAGNLIQDLFRGLSASEYKQFESTVRLLRTHLDNPSR